MEKNLSSITASEIVALLEEPTDDRRPLKTKLRYEASVKELVEALRLSNTELTRSILCDILGARQARTAIAALIECLDDPSPDVKNDAAEALGKIGSPKAGEALLQHFIKDPQTWFAIALGAIEYRQSIPYLIEALNNPNLNIRGGAAWSLGYMKVHDACEALERAMEIETDDLSYSYTRIKAALEEIKEDSYHLKRCRD